MKRICYLFNFIIIFLVSCSYISYEVKVKESDLFIIEDSLYLPTPIKNNSVFIGYSIVKNFKDEYAIYKKNYGYFGYDIIKDKNPIFAELTYDVLKEFSKNNKVTIKAEYWDLSNEELFVLDGYENNYGIRAAKLDKYPREITIPKEMNGISIFEVAAFGFYYLEDLLIVNTESTIRTLNKFAFSNTGLYSIDKYKYADKTAFSNTFIDGQLQKYEFTKIYNSYKKEIKINDISFEVTIALNGGSVLKEELELAISRPVLENKVFEYYKNEEGYKIYFEKDKLYRRFTLKEYYRFGLGLIYDAVGSEVTDEIYRFKYLEASDSYRLFFLDNDLEVSKLVLPDTYLDKPITEIRDFNNKYVVEVEIGKYVKRIDGMFCTPNLKRIKLPNDLEYIKPNAFSGTLLTEIDLPKNITNLEDGVFAYTFINKVYLRNELEYISKTAFSRNKDISLIIDEFDGIY